MVFYFHPKYSGSGRLFPFFLLRYATLRFIAFYRVRSFTSSMTTSLAQPIDANFKPNYNTARKSRTFSTARPLSGQISIITATKGHHSFRSSARIRYRIKHGSLDDMSLHLPCLSLALMRRELVPDILGAQPIKRYLIPLGSPNGGRRRQNGSVGGEDIITSENGAAHTKPTW